MSDEQSHARRGRRVGSAVRARVLPAAVVACVLALTACSDVSSTVSPRVYTLPARQAAAPVDPLLHYADARLSVMSVREKVASLLMMHAAGTDQNALRAFVDGNDLGGMIFMGDNIPAAESGLTAITHALSTDAGLPVLVGVDQEGGIVRRVRSDTQASARQLRDEPPVATREAFAARAKLLDSLGFSVNFGIVADVTASRDSFIYPRVLGTTAAESAARVAEAVAGESGSVFSTIKHFPGHGAAPGDSHSSIPTTSMGFDEWMSTHAPPFKAGVDAGAEFVMFGHLTFTAIDSEPASLSARWHEILRDDLGFDGISITDDLRMLQASGDPAYADPVTNAIRALNAGNTVLLFVGGVDPVSLTDGLVAAVADGRVSEATLDAAALKLLALRRSLSEQTGPYVHCFEQCQALVD